ncbi:MAG: ribonuclease P protein component [Dysgonamonadaceae bacterium]|jgi:ribonuclease P protein component|nr:ribonuclease P protein component [Dysgonamonadaceae bacterium]
MDKGLRFTLKKKERVSGEKRIENLFANGRSFIAYPLRVVYVVCDKSESESQVSIFVSVPKKRIGSAVNRNRLKRLVRETYRLNKHLLLSALRPETRVDVAFVYVKDELSDFAAVEKGMIKSLKEMADSQRGGE